MSAAPSAVAQRISGRPEELAKSVGLPAPSSRTKRFISSVRAAGARREKDSTLRAVRNFANCVSSCAQAAERRSRSAAEGASGELDLAETSAGEAAGRGGELVSGRELDSCARA